MNGIDISQWQGDMDLTPYKDGFVILRGGFWTSADPWAERNIAKCEKLGIPWGLYWYSYALNEALRIILEEGNEKRQKAPARRVVRHGGCRRVQGKERLSGE